MKRQTILRNFAMGALPLCAIAMAMAQGGMDHRTGPGGPGQEGPGRPGAPGMGQRGGPGMHRSAMLLLNMKSVQTELKLSTDQVKRIQSMKPRQGGPGGPDGPGGPGGPGFGGPGQGNRGQGGPGQGGPGHAAPGRPAGDQHGQGMGRPGEPTGGRPPMGPLGEILTDAQAKRLHQLMIQFDAPMTMLDPHFAEQLGLSEAQRQSIHQAIQENMPRPERNTRMDWNAMMAGKAAARKEALSVLTSAQRSKWNELIGAPFSNWQAPQPK